MQQKWLILTSVACGTFMATLDSSIVNVALPSITASFHTGIVTSRWVVISYLFSITGLLLFFGKLADVIGRKAVFNLGYIVFTFGSLLCGVAHNIGQLIAFRGIQGLGAAMLMANGPAMITAAFPSNERGKALGTMSMVVSTGLVVGPTLGGALVRLVGWPSIFFVNLPFGILGTYLVYRYVPANFSMSFNADEVPDENNPQRLTQAEIFKREKKLPFWVRFQIALDKLRYFDWLGALFWMFIQFGYSLAIDKENVLGLAGPLQKFIIFSAAGLFIMFLIWEWSIKDPILDLTLFKSKTFLASNAGGLFNFIAISSVTLLMPFYFQNIKGLPPHKVGAFMTAIPLAIFFTAPIAGRLSDRYGSRILSSVGMSVICLSMLFFSIPGVGIGSSNTTFIFIFLLITGIGIGLFQSPNNNAIMGSVNKHQLGVASALLATVRNFGLVTGTALCTGLLTFYYNSETLEHGVSTTPTANFVSSLRLTFFTLAVVCSTGIFLSTIKEDKINVT